MDRIDHTAVVVRDMDAAIGRWRDLTGGVLETREIVEHQRVEIAMLQVGDTRLELIRPFDSESGVARFLQKHGESLHHIAFQVGDIRRAMADLENEGYVPIDREPRAGAHGMIAFLHPRSTNGVLVELIQPENPPA